MRRRSLFPATRDSDNKLDLSETWIYSCSHTVSQAELDAGGSLSNTVTADSNESGPDTDTLLIPVSQNPLLEVVKSSTTSSITAAGQVVPYRFAVSNKGNVALTGITVTDPKCDAAAVFVSGDTRRDNKLDLSETWIYSCSHTVTRLSWMRAAASATRSRPTRTSPVPTPTRC